MGCFAMGNIWGIEMGWEVVCCGIGLVRRKGRSASVWREGKGEAHPAEQSRLCPFTRASTQPEHSRDRTAVRQAGRQAGSDHRLRPSVRLREAIPFSIPDKLPSLPARNTADFHPGQPTPSPCPLIASLPCTDRLQRPIRIHQKSTPWHPSLPPPDRQTDGRARLVTYNTTQHNTTQHRCMHASPRSVRLRPAPPLRTRCVQRYTEDLEGRKERRKEGRADKTPTPVGRSVFVPASGVGKDWLTIRVRHACLRACEEE